jgi:hypothetical protein
MARRTQPDERTQRITRYLSSKNAAQVVEAQLELQSMPPDEAVTILMFMFARDRRRRRLLYIWSPAFLAVAFLGRWLLSFTGKDLDFGFISPLIIVLALAWATSTRLQQNSASLLVHFEDPRLIDALVVLLKTGTAGTHTPQSILTRLLQTLTPAQSPIVSRESRSFLNYSLLHNRDREFVFAILAAWEQIGDHAAIPFVEKLSRGNAVLGRDQTLRHTAMEALPAIRDCANRASISETLLRPADGSESTPLLRSAASGNTQEEALLRPTAEHPTQ